MILFCENESTDFIPIAPIPIPALLWHYTAFSLLQSQIRRKSKDTLKKAYLGARAKARDAEKADEKWRAGSASVMVINGEKLVIANMGEYRAVVCRDGVAHQISSGRQHTAKRHWSRKLFSGRSTSYSYLSAYTFCYFSGNNGHFTRKYFA